MCDVDAAQHLPGPWFLDWEAASRRRLCFFPRGNAYTVAGIFVDGKVGQPPQLSEFIGLVASCEAFSNHRANSALK